MKITKENIKKFAGAFVEGTDKTDWRKINRIFLLVDFVLLVVISVVLGACIGYEIDWGIGGLLVGGILGLPAGLVIGFIFVSGAMLIVEMAENIAKLAKFSDSDNNE